MANPMITAAWDFTDDNNPLIHYSNPIGNSIYSIEACIAFPNPPGSQYADTIVVPYRNISKTGTSYRFYLTDQEREALVYNTFEQGVDKTSRTVKFFIRYRRTSTSSYEYAVSTKTFSVNPKNIASPTCVWNGDNPNLGIVGDSELMIFANSKYGRLVHEMYVQWFGKSETISDKVSTHCVWTMPLNGDIDYCKYIEAKNNEKVATGWGGVCIRSYYTRLDGSQIYQINDTGNEKTARYARFDARVRDYILNSLPDGTVVSINDGTPFAGQTVYARNMKKDDTDLSTIVRWSFDKFVPQYSNYIKDYQLIFRTGTDANATQYVISRFAGYSELSSHVYNTGDKVIQYKKSEDGNFIPHVYTCKQNNTSGTWDENKWDETEHIESLRLSNISIPAGTYYVSITLLDSRNKWSDLYMSDQVTVYEYSKPRVGKFNANRCDSAGQDNPAGTQLKLYCQAIQDGGANLGGRNMITLSYNSKTKNGSYGSDIPMDNHTIITPSSVEYLPSLAYDIRFKIEDTLGNYNYVYTSVPLGITDFNLTPYGAGFGMYHDKDKPNTIQSAWDLEINGNMLHDYICNRGSTDITIQLDTEKTTTGTWFWKLYKSGWFEASLQFQFDFYPIMTPMINANYKDYTQPATADNHRHIMYGMVFYQDVRSIPLPVIDNIDINPYYIWDYSVVFTNPHDSKGWNYTFDPVYGVITRSYGCGTTAQTCSIRAFAPTLERDRPSERTKVMCIMKISGSKWEPKESTT